MTNVRVEPKPATWMKPLEVVYLIVGLGIMIRGTIDHGLTPTELGAGMFLIGLIPVSRADKRGTHKESDTLRSALIRWLER